MIITVNDPEILNNYINLQKQLLAIDKNRIGKSKWKLVLQYPTL